NLRANKLDVEYNRKILDDREAYAVRHAEFESDARYIYQQVRDIVLQEMKHPSLETAWPFVMVFSCYEYTNHRKHFAHGHCLYMMISLQDQENNCLLWLRK